MADSSILNHDTFRACDDGGQHGCADQLQSARLDSPVLDRTLVALIDCVQFSRDCLIHALGVLSPELAMVPFATARECIDKAPPGLRMILYYAHQDSSPQPAVLQNVNELRQAFAGTPIVVLSDASASLQPGSIRAAIGSGAQGYIPTANTAMPAAVAAIRLVRDGGTIAPVDVLLGKHTKSAIPASDDPDSKLTPRQLTVLTHLRLGKANKIIAYELGMSESTVKVHVRNIMRRMGATNRTQAVYKSHQLLPASAMLG